MIINQRVKDSIRGAIISSSVGTWENGGRTMLDEVDLEDAVEYILDIIEKEEEKEEPKY